MNKFYKILIWTAVIASIIASLSIMTIAVQVTRIQEQIIRHDIMLVQVYFEVYGTQFTAEYVPELGDKFFSMFNSRIDKLGKALDILLEIEKEDTK